VDTTTGDSSGDTAGDTTTTTTPPSNGRGVLEQVVAIQTVLDDKVVIDTGMLAENKTVIACLPATFEALADVQLTSLTDLASNAPRIRLGATEEWQNDTDAGLPALLRFYGGEFKATVLLNKGDTEAPKAKAPGGPVGPLCSSPDDFYAPTGRSIIGRLLETWLEQKGLVAFELLHRPDMAEALEAAGGELQHAVQKFAVPQAVARGASVHDIIRGLHPVIDKVSQRLRADRRSGRFPVVTPETMGEVSRALVEVEDGRYLLAAAVCAYIAGRDKGQDKLDALSKSLVWEVNRLHSQGAGLE
jgi:hypothetical protein